MTDMTERMIKTEGYADPTITGVVHAADKDAKRRKRRKRLEVAMLRAAIALEKYDFEVVGKVSIMDTRTGNVLTIDGSTIRKGKL